MGILAILAIIGVGFVVIRQLGKNVSNNVGELASLNKYVPILIINICMAFYNFYWTWHHIVSHPKNEDQGPLWLKIAICLVASFFGLTIGIVILIVILLAWYFGWDMRTGYDKLP